MILSFLTPSIASHGKGLDWYILWEIVVRSSWKFFPTAYGLGYKGLVWVMGQWGIRQEPTAAARCKRTAAATAAARGTLSERTTTTKPTSPKPQAQPKEKSLAHAGAGTGTGVRGHAHAHTETPAACARLRVRYIYHVSNSN
jgi:hypothetical protein